MPDAGFVFVIFIILVALAFDYTNGMHDAANSIATVVSTRVLTPRQAVVCAAFFNFVAFLIFGTGVARTIGAGMIDISIVTPQVIFAALLGAIGWNLFTWWMGLPTSSSHALIGGYAGAAIVKAGPAVIIARIQAASIRPPAASNFSPRLSTASATAATTPRKRWASSPA